MSRKPVSIHWMMAMIGVFGHKSLGEQVSPGYRWRRASLTLLASSADSGFSLLGVCRLSGVLQHLSLPEDKISVSIMIV